MSAKLVDYLDAQGGVPAPVGLAYDYLLGGDGLYVAAHNRWLEARVPVARARVRGLPPLGAAFALRTGRLCQVIWQSLVAEATVRACQDREVLLVVTYDEGVGYRLLQPRQIVGATRVLYRPPVNALLEVHSHPHGPAVFSPVDDADERRLCLYGVLGRLSGGQPEVALRVGVYGYYLPLPWEAVFGGERGPFRALHHEILAEEEDDVELPDRP
ncbi:MAG: Mov34/MPN/PAD-1 family protein [Chloroflexota bacterium]